MESQVREIKLIDYNLSKHILSMMMLYVLSANKAIRRSHLMNLNTLISTYDPKAYEKDQDRVIMIDFIKKGVDARLNHNLTDPQLILYQIKGHITENDSVDNYGELGTSDIQWLNQMISNTIDQAFVYKDIDNMIDICTRFKTTTNISEKAKIVEQYKDQVTKSQNVFRKNKNEVEEDEMFSLEEGIFETRIKETYDEIANPSRKLLMGNQALNELFGGGFAWRTVVAAVCGGCEESFGCGRRRFFVRTGRLFGGSGESVPGRELVHSCFGIGGRAF